MLVEKIGEFVESDIAEIGIIAGGQLAAGSHAAGDETRHAGFRFELVAGGAGDLGGYAIDLDGAVTEAVLGQGQAVAAEGVGLDGFTADTQEGFVYLTNDVRSGDDQVVDAVLIGLAAVIVGREVTGLDAGPHGAVEDDDMVVDGVEIASVGEGLRCVFHGEHDNTELVSSVV